MTKLQQWRTDYWEVKSIVHFRRKPGECVNTGRWMVASVTIKANTVLTEEGGLEEGISEGFYVPTQV